MHSFIHSFKKSNLVSVHSYMYTTVTRTQLTNLNFSTLSQVLTSFNLRVRKQRFIITLQIVKLSNCLTQKMIIITAITTSQLFSHSTMVIYFWRQHRCHKRRSSCREQDSYFGNSPVSLSSTSETHVYAEQRWNHSCFHL